MKSLIILLPVLALHLCSCTAMKGNPKTGSPGLIYGMTGGLVRTQDNKLAAETTRKKMREAADINKDGILDASENEAYLNEVTAFDAVTTKSQARTLLGIAGAVAGGVAGNNMQGLSSGTGAMMGFGAGSVLGNVWGSNIAAKKKYYATTEGYLDAVIDSTAKARIQIASYNNELSSKIAALDTKTNDLTSRAERTRRATSELRSHRRKTASTLAEAKGKLSRIQEEVTALKAIKEGEKQKASPEKIGELDSSISGLLTDSATLKRNIKALEITQSKISL